MIDEDPMANGHAPGAEHAFGDLYRPSGLAEPHDTAGHGGAPGVEDPVSPESGSADARPARVGVVPPADWFLSALEEAAPTSQPASEPVRPVSETRPSEPEDEQLDGAEYDYLEPAEYDEPGEPGYGYREPAGYEEPGEPGYGYREPAGYEEPGEPGYGYREPAGYDEPGYAGGPDATRPEPVVGPTEALRGRAGGPGLAVPPGARYGLYDPEDRSVWQLSHGVWQDSAAGWEDPGAARSGEPRT